MGDLSIAGVDVGHTGPTWPFLHILFVTLSVNLPVNVTALLLAEGCMREVGN